MKVAIVHYWLVNMRGGEKVIEALCEMFPQADVFTHVYKPSQISALINRHRVRTSFIGRLPWAERFYQSYLPLMPLALEQLDLRDYDLVISSESGPAKGVLVSPQTLHVCYCHAPMRYLWDMYHDYRATASWIRRLLMPPLTHYLRLWDLASAQRVDHFVANSRYVASRIEKYYRRPAEVIHPPVAVGDFEPGQGAGEFYLMVGQLTHYKRADLAVETFNQSGRPLIIIGEGEQYHSLRKVAASNIRMLGRQPFAVIREHYQRCKALIFPGIEDFGIVPVEAMASGRPVIALRQGGAQETVVENETGIFFEEQRTAALQAAIERFESVEARFVENVAGIRAHAQRFEGAVFKNSLRRFIDAQLAHSQP